MRRVLAAALLAASCNSYDPSFGDMPFRCGSDEPKCPDGYVAEGPEPNCICKRAALVPDSGSGYFCNFDPSDTAEARNDSPTNAATIDAETNPVTNLVDRAICPRGDEDYYAFTVTRVGTHILMRVAYDRTRLSPGLDITTQEGASLMPTRGEPEPGVVTAEHDTTFPGIYLVKVIAAEELNYTLRLEVRPPE